MISLFCNSGHRDSIPDVEFAEIIQKVYDELLPASSEEIIRIEKATINISVNSGELAGFESLVRDNLIKELKLLFNDTEKGTVVKKEAEVKNNFFHFLQTGSLPWYAEELNFSDKLLDAPEFLSELIKKLKERPDLVRRLMFQTDQKCRWKLVSKLTNPDFSKKLRAITEKIKEFCAVSSKVYDASFRSEVLFITGVLQHLTLETNQPDLEKIIKKLWPGFLLDIESFFPDNLKELTVNITKVTGLKLEAEIPVQNVSNSLPLEEIYNGDGETLPVENAGIILLHPFLKRFFERTGLLEDDRFQNDFCRQRAVCLLHYVASGELIFPDDKLVMAKFICDYPIQQPVPLELPISDYEISECDNLIKNVIDHWEALKNTGAEAFRSTFLKRKGVLIKDTTGFLLHIENQTEDILLNRLPWPITPVKIPWKASVLTVKWN